jgi:hypothetical protein
MFDHVDRAMQALVKNQIQWNKDLFLALKLARQKICKYYPEVRPMTGIHLIWAHIPDLFSML